MITKNFHPNYGGNLEFSKINKKNKVRKGN